MKCHQDKSTIKIHTKTERTCGEFLTNSALSFTCTDVMLNKEIREQKAKLSLPRF